MYVRKKPNSITTAYSNYTLAGLYQKKTVSAADYASRTETYTYDATPTVYNTNHQSVKSFN
ncbi:MAG: hypothetical protein FWH59_04265 [Lentimicrobiaceae bacterium]|nr:hypothetical protein [Lentimicrobiaceae bacterium]